MRALGPSQCRPKLKSRLYFKMMHLMFECNLEWEDLARTFRGMSSKSKILMNFDLGSVSLSHEQIFRWFMSEAAELGYPGPDRGCYQYDRTMIAKYGSGRVKPVWAERLGKKYYWIIARRLLGILCDNVNKRRVAWEDSVNPSIPLLQGIDMRDIDPTDLRPKNEVLPLSFDWWSHAYYEFGATQRLKHAEWLSLSDFPNLFAILRILDQQGTGWVHLSLTRSQRTKRAKDKQNEYPYRNLTTLATSVFVPSRDLEDIQRLLSNKQFSPMMDSYTPEVYRLFLGEYPKTIAYDQLLGGAIDLSLDFPGTDQAALTHCVLRGGKSWEYNSAVIPILPVSTYHLRTSFVSVS